MVRTRIFLVDRAAEYLSMSLLVATRYAACRRQFKTIVGSSEERKLIDYQTHQQLIGSNMSIMTVIRIAKNFLEVEFLKAKAEANLGNFSLLDQLHHFSAGLKALSTDYAYEGIDKLRLGCGGAGFTMASGIADTWTKCAVLPTGEGINVVMAMQSSRYLLKQLKKAGSCTGFFSYINNLNDLCEQKSPAKNAVDFALMRHLD